MVQFVTNEQQFNKTIQENPIVIVDFLAHWCGPCKMIGPLFDDLQRQYPKALFIKVDVDQVSSVAAKHDITAMPTFVSFVAGNRYQDLRGADRNGLVRLVQSTIDFYENAIQRQKEAIEKKKQEQQKLRETPLEETEEELMRKPVKELKQMIQERGWSLAGLAEKRDLVKKLKTGE
jgi:thioredoxin 1